MCRKFIGIKVSLIFFMFCFVQLSFAECLPRQRLVTVTGGGEVKVVPDEVVINLSVWILDKELAVGKEKMSAVVKKVLDFTKKLGIDPKHVQTDYIKIDPTYEDYYKKSNFLGYTCSENITVILKDISKFEELLTGALNLGVNRVYGVEFRTTSLRKYRDEARKMAMKAAKEKAQALAAELGQNIGRPYSITEATSQSYNNFAQVATQRISNEVLSYGTGLSEEYFSPGQIEVNANIEVSFELE